MAFFYENTPEWKPNEPATYMKTLTRKQTSTIFKARSRMIKVKGNYKNGHPNLTCRICKKSRCQRNFPPLEKLVSLAGQKW